MPAETSTVDPELASQRPPDGSSGILPVTRPGDTPGAQPPILRSSAAASALPGSVCSACCRLARAGP
jgi:hypothetical protein